ncbi:MAG: imidazoleglycerol-phosphate dehydratase [Armatimonadetes bacterium]|nr:imidazoleglycerol-phosphate dehydratase [Armatimonadota bacterium]
MSKDAPGVRYAEVDKETRATRVQAVIDLDGGERRDVSTGIPFFDHLLGQFAEVGQLDLGVVCEGDLLVDDHHSVEEVGTVLGRAIRLCLDDNTAIHTVAGNITPVDDALVTCALDLAGRGQLHWDVPFKRERIGTMATESVREFFRAVSAGGHITIHLRKMAGENDHHLCEALFKAFGFALHEATRRMERHSLSGLVKSKRD